MASACDSDQAPAVSPSLPSFPLLPFLVHASVPITSQLAEFPNPLTQSREPPVPSHDKTPTPACPHMCSVSHTLSSHDNSQAATSSATDLPSSNSSNHVLSSSPSSSQTEVPSSVLSPPESNVLPHPEPIATADPASRMVTRSQRGIRKPNPKYTLHTILDSTEVEPTCYSQAFKHPQWRAAMGLEFDALLQAGTWSLVPRHPSMNVLPNKWVYKIKKKSDGSVERYKARLVANGFHQQEGVDFQETFSPVVKHTTIRVILALAVQSNWPIHQLDVQNAFLNGFVTEEVYMHQPRGFVDSNFPDHVCRLHRSLYGLRQSPRAWHKRFSDFLEEVGFNLCQSDHSLFTYRHSNIFIVLLIYVDDILLTGSCSKTIAHLIQHLHTKFKMKNLGPVNYFLGLQITRTPSHMIINQCQYILALLQKTGFIHSKPLSTLAISGQKLSMHDGDPLSDATEYRQVVGALQYITISRPDLTYAMNQVCQYMHQPTTAHWNAVKRILRFLKGSVNHGLLYKPGSTHIHAYCDADYAGNPDDRHSTGGYVIYLGSNPISWSAKKQRTVSRSSTEAEYRQLAYTAAELSWLRSLFKDLGIPLQPPVLWCDNVSSLALASNPVFHARTKHLEVDYHYVREKVIRGELQVRYISTKDQVADIFTKGLSRQRFTGLQYKLMVRDPTISLRGCVRLQVVDQVPSRLSCSN